MATYRLAPATQAQIPFLARGRQFVVALVDR